MSRQQRSPAVYGVATLRLNLALLASQMTSRHWATDPNDSSRQIGPQFERVSGKYRLQFALAEDRRTRHTVARFPRGAVPIIGTKQDVRRRYHRLQRPQGRRIRALGGVIVHAPQLGQRAGGWLLWRI